MRPIARIIVALFTLVLVLTVLPLAPVLAAADDLPVSVTLTLAVNGNGTTDPEPGVHTYAPGTTVDLQATPADGWQFSGWTGEVANHNATHTTIPVNTDQTVTASFMETPPLSGAIAYVSGTGSEQGIYRINVDGTGQMRLTDNAAADSDPAWSPDGTRIAFISDRDGPVEIYVMNADGSQPTRLTNNPAGSTYLGGRLAWSPDGSRIAFSALVDGKSEIFVMDSDGGNIAQLTQNEFEDYHPAWSPDGTQIAFISDRDSQPEPYVHVANIYVMNTDGSSQTRVSNEPAGSMGGLDWSPDGTKFVFGSLSNDSPPASQGICIIDVDGTDKVALPFPGFVPVWSPDGARITMRCPMKNVYMIRVDGSGLTPFPTTTVDNTQPSWGQPSQVLPPEQQVATGDATDIGFTTVRLNGTLGPLGAAPGMDVSFEYGTEPGVYSNETPARTVDSPGAFSEGVWGLESKTTYYFRAKAVGAAISYGEEKSFTTREIPTVATGDATDIQKDSVILHGDIESLGGGAEIDVSFEYGESESYGSETTPENMRATGTFSATLSGLMPDTTYHFHAKGVAGEAKTYGADVAFTTLPAMTPPSVTTNSATSVTETSAVLNGSLTGLGTASSVQMSFEWGMTPAYGQTTPAQEMGAPGAFSAALTGLASGATYYFRAQAVGDGTGAGSEMYFQTTFPFIPAGGGGGVGGGGEVAPPAPSVSTVNLSGLTSGSSLKVNSLGSVQDDARLETQKGEVAFDIPAGVVMQDSHGNALHELSATIVDSPPEPPPQKALILAYDFGPDGATFDPAITLSVKYDRQSLPEGVNESELVLAYWDGSRWNILESMVDTRTGSISAKVTHFSEYAVIGELPPAKFDVSGLEITPGTAQPGEIVTISATVANSGGSPGAYVVSLLINGVKEAQKEIGLDPGASMKVGFNVQKSAGDTYKVDVNGLGGIFRVEVPEAEPAAQPEPPATAAPVPVPATMASPEQTENAAAAALAPVSSWNWGLTGGIAAAIVVIGLAIFLVRRRV